MTVESCKSRSDPGFTLVEVVVAIALLMMVTVAALPLFMNSMKLSASQQRSQEAVTIASKAIEQVRSKATGATISIDTLVSGRTQHGPQGVQDVWTDSLHTAAPGVSDTYLAWDSAPTSTPNPPVTANTTQEGTVYRVDVLIGTCYQDASTVSNAKCTKISGYAGTTDPGTPSGPGHIRMARVIALVTWTAGSGCSETTPCSYQATTLFNLNADQSWRSDI